MSLFKQQGDSLLVVREKPFQLEKEIQNLTEKNSNAIFGLIMVKSEFRIGNFRIDSLCFDPENKAFVIIEYKKDKNYSVIDQGYAYLSLMLNNKADFILEYNENFPDNTLRRESVDWSQSKVFFISPSFTDYQKQAINFKDLPIELFEIKRFENDTILFNKIATQGSQESVKTISRQSEIIESVSNEIVVYDELSHVDKGDDRTKELYSKYRAGILNIGEISVEPKAKYIAFKAVTNVVDVEIQRRALKLHINLKAGELNDPLSKARNMTGIGHYGNGDYEVVTDNEGELEYILSLIRQAYEKQVAYV